jgi:bifunctional dethiobiotin synthetase / adenosylmethionine---8-amino-7-oxononanoate aminotransferase
LIPQPSDDEILQKLYLRLEQAARDQKSESGSLGVALIETAGGVLSPAPSGKPQADVFRPMRLPAVLVADHRLGGIGSTISAAESLILRGYDIDSVICFDDQGVYENASYLQSYFADMDIKTNTVPWLPDLEGKAGQEEFQLMSSYYQSTSIGSELHNIADDLIQKHSSRLETVNRLAKRTAKSIWHPFTQHKHVRNAEDILVIDSAHGDHFQVKHTTASLSSSQEQDAVSPVLYPAFDGSASWWTQVSNTSLLYTRE